MNPRDTGTERPYRRLKELRVDEMAHWDAGQLAFALREAQLSYEWEWRNALLDELGRRTAADGQFRDLFRRVYDGVQGEVDQALMGDVRAIMTNEPRKNAEHRNEETG